MEDARVVVYPGDRHGCGYHRLIWPSEELINQGESVSIIAQKDRHVKMVIDDEKDLVVDAEIPDGVNVVVLQRVTHKYLAQAVSVMRGKGVAVVIDIDDDLSSIHPSNPAWDLLRPNREQRYVGKDHLHSWRHLGEACRDATLVTATTPALIKRYAAHGNGVVLPNYLAEHYYGVAHDDSDVLGWPASLHSHPNDPEVVGHAVSRLVDDGATFRAIGNGEGIADAFGIKNVERALRDDRIWSLKEWPQAIAQLGVGIAPLADTRFNEAKSWLKPLELAAVGVPWVASPRAEYRRLHQLGCGILVDRPKDWYRVLRRLLASETRRAELSDAGRATAATLRLRDHAWRWLEAWTLALKIERTGSATVATSVN